MELYHYDGECLAKAEELGHPDLVSIVQKQVRRSPKLLSPIYLQVSTRVYLYTGHQEVTGRRVSRTGRIHLQSGVHWCAGMQCDCQDCTGHSYHQTA